MDQNEMSNLYRGPSIDVSYQVSYHLAKRLQRKSCFRNRPIRNKNCLWRPCLLTDQNGMSNQTMAAELMAAWKTAQQFLQFFYVLWSSNAKNFWKDNWDEFHSLKWIIKCTEMVNNCLMHVYAIIRVKILIKRPGRGYR